MSILQSLKSLFGGKAKDLADANNDGKVNADDLSHHKENVTQALDTNDDGKVNQEDLGPVRDLADVNKDGQVDKQDASSLKQNF